jgi:RloB-like protein
VPKTKRPLNRDGGIERDASLIIIASEDTFAVEHYLTRFTTRRVAFKVLPTADGHSSPKALIERLDAWRLSTEFQDDDEFWICFDKDHWGEPNHIHGLTQVLKHCRDKSFRVAISNPCFELWILLHFDDPPLPEGISCNDIAERLRSVVGGYNKVRCCTSLEFTRKGVEDAIRRAQSLDRGDDIPDYPMTRAYQILKRLIEKDRIEIRPPAPTKVDQRP